MKKNPHLLYAGAAILLVAACSQGDENANQVPANEQASDMNSAMHDSNNPFAQAEMQMNERMMAAVGADPSDTWIRKMIEHHRGAVDMSNIVLGQTQDERVRRMAQMTVDKQTKEIEELERMVRQGTTPSQEAASLYLPVETEMHNRMMAASGAAVDETWMRKMIEHHRGGIEMSDIVLAQGPTAEVRAKAQKTRSDQQSEVGDLEKMLRGEDPSPEPAATPAASKASSPPAPQAKAASRAAEPKAAPRAAPQEPPKAGEPEAPASGSTCLPEHRAAGHC